jgi:serine/threonine-protein kinase
VALALGTRLGSYEIISLLGTGGMGEVYRARDTKLNRDIALKILPDAFTLDSDRIARFRREAQVLASLNHPNIAAIYGFEDSGTTHALVLELVEGPTLADRIAKGPILLEEALPIAKQIADALEAAHEQGIIHRDLKPANIKVREDGTVKVLDFGLAKAMEPASATGPMLTNSPTITTPAMVTGVGTLLGTAAYMSPEQAKGRPADKRSDVWAFGAVLYEMLTGRRAFDGEDVSDTLAAVLRSVPDWTALSPDLPVAIRTLVQQCLEKDRRTRIADISTARFLMNEPALAVARVAPVPARGPIRQPLWRRVIPIGVVGIMAAGLTAIAMLIAGGTTPSHVTRFVFVLPDGPQFSGMNRRVITISPDGRQMAYVAGSRLFVRSMTDFEPRSIPGTESAGLTSPVFSPDGKDVAFYSNPDQTLKRIAVAGGVASTICQLEGTPLGVSWSGDSIVFGQSGRGILRVSSKGGKPELLVATSKTQVEALLGPQLLPGDRAALFTVVPGRGNLDGAQLAVQSLASGQRKTLTEGTDARYVTTGHLVYWLRGTLYAVPFDVGRLELAGTPVPLVQGVNRTEGSPSPNFSVSDTGTLVYVPSPIGSSSGRSLIVVDRAGHDEALKVTAAAYTAPRFSPDGKHLAVGTDDGKEANIWVYDLSGTTSIRQLTFGGKNKYPVWSANGERIAFQSDREGDLGIFWQRADGADTAERLTKPEKGVAHIPESWSQSNGRLSFSETGADESASLWTVSVKDRKLEQFGDIRSGASFNSEFSPDGRWLAYTLRDRGRVTVHIRSFPPSGGSHYQLRDNGHHPMWSRDGKELFYMSTTNTGGLFAVSFTEQPSPAFGIPSAVATRQTFRATPVTPRNHDITPDGKRFIAVSDAAPNGSTAATAPQIRVVLDWFSELQQRVPTR